MTYDFSGWASKSNVRCTDGRIILNNAFADNDNDKVPLVWNHDHQDPSRVLGHAMLKNVPNEGVYAYCSFNDTNDEAWRKLLSYLENDDAQEEYYARKSKEGEEKDTKKTSDDTKTNNNLSVKDALVKDFLNLLFGQE